MVNKFGFPVKNYYVQAAAESPAAAGNLAIMALLGIVNALQGFLTERMRVSRRVSAYDRRQEPTYVTGQVS